MRHLRTCSACKQPGLTANCRRGKSYYEETGERVDSSTARLFRASSRVRHPLLPPRCDFPVQWVPVSPDRRRPIAASPAGNQIVTEKESDSLREEPKLDEFHCASSSVYVPAIGARRQLFSVLQIKLTREESVNSAYAGNVPGCARIARHGTFVINLLGGRRKELQIIVDTRRSFHLVANASARLTRTRSFRLRRISKNNVNERATRGRESHGVSACNF